MKYWRKTSWDCGITENMVVNWRRSGWPGFDWLYWLRASIIWIVLNLVDHKLFFCLSIRVLSRKGGQIIIWMVEMGLRWVPDLVTEVLKFVGDQNQTLTDSVGPSNQAHPGPNKPESPQSMDCKPTDLGSQPLGYPGWAICLQQVAGPTSPHMRPTKSKQPFILNGPFVCVSHGTYQVKAPICSWRTLCVCACVRSCSPKSLTISATARD